MHFCFLAAKKKINKILTVNVYTEVVYILRYIYRISFPLRISFLRRLEEKFVDGDEIYTKKEEIKIVKEDQCSIINFL